MKSVTSFACFKSALAEPLLSDIRVIREVPPKLRLHGPSFSETGDKMRSQDENSRQKKGVTKLVFSPKSVLIF